jgi:hypothetical protein
MAASSAQLLAFYRAVFRADGARSRRIREVCDILGSLDRWSPETGIGAKLARAVGLPEGELELSLEQLGCLQSAFIARPMSALAPAAESLQPFYERLFFEDDSLLSLRRLQAAARDCYLFGGDASLEKEKRDALFQFLGRALRAWIGCRPISARSCGSSAGT